MQRASKEWRKSRVAAALSQRHVDDSAPPLRAPLDVQPAGAGEEERRVVVKGYGQNLVRQRKRLLDPCRSPALSTIAFVLLLRRGERRKGERPPWLAAFGGQNRRRGAHRYRHT